MTGSTSGIGEATAKQLAQHGAHVLVLGRGQELGEGAVAIRAAGGKADLDPVQLVGQPCAVLEIGAADTVVDDLDVEENGR